MNLSFCISLNILAIGTEFTTTIIDLPDEICQKQQVELDAFPLIEDSYHCSSLTMLKLIPIKLAEGVGISPRHKSLGDTLLSGPPSVFSILYRPYNKFCPVIG